MPFEPDDPNYPKYVLTFRGEAVRDANGNMMPGDNDTVTGPHTMMLESTRTGTRFTLKFERQTTDEAPNILITVTGS